MSHIYRATVLLGVGLLAQSTHTHARLGEAGMRERKPQTIAELLDRMSHINTREHALARLFQLGDENMTDLVSALDSNDPQVSLNAQKVIRYLGNPSGMRALVEWYSKQPGRYAVAGPIPAPLSEWDYEQVERYFLAAPVDSWGRREQEYTYALALDGSARAHDLLQKLAQRLPELPEDDTVRSAFERARRYDPAKPFVATNCLTDAFLENSFYLSQQVRAEKKIHVHLLALSGSKDKALFEITPGGTTYHVVIKRSGEGWVFQSVHVTVIH